MTLVVFICVAAAVLIAATAVWRRVQRVGVRHRLTGSDGSALALAHHTDARGPWRARRRSPDRQALAVFVESVAGLLRTGLSLPVALDMASRDDGAPLADSVRPALLHAGHVGLPVAMHEWAATLRVDHPQAPLVARALIMVSHGGVGAATALDGLAEGLRATISVEREVAALSSQARLSGAVMAVVPVGFAALLSGTDPAARAFLTGTPLGLACLTIGLTLDVVAWLIMRRLAVVSW